jgi:hypothetical protein
MSHAATGSATHKDKFVEIISVNHNMVLIREPISREEMDVPFTELANVWPAAPTLDTFAEIAEVFGARFAYDMIVTFTRTTGWADVIKAKYEDLY